MVENPSDIAHGMWSNNESMKSSTWKELTAVKNILFSINKFLHNKRIKWFYKQSKCSQASKMQFDLNFLSTDK
jgi:hypothetical protein